MSATLNCERLVDVVLAGDGRQVERKVRGCGNVAVVATESEPETVVSVGVVGKVTQGVGYVFDIIRVDDGSNNALKRVPVSERAAFRMGQSHHARGVGVAYGQLT